MRLVTSTLIFQCILTTTFSLNILLTSIDNWTSKNVRFLQSHLQQQGHNVILMAPLYQQNLNLSIPIKFTPGIKDIRDGGEYGHLLPVHQKYYFKMSNENQKRAKQVVFEDDVLKEEIVEEEEEKDVVLNNQYGSDPSNHNAWYINCDAMNALNIAMNLLIPKFYPDFEIDLVLIGPNEGLDHSQIITSMVHQVNTEKIDAIAVSTQDFHQVYYQDEKYFRASFGDIDFQLSKSNVYTKNIKLIDRHVVSLVDNLVQLGRNDNENTDGGASATIGLHLQYPSMNFRNAYCQTSPTTDLDYQVMLGDKKSKNKQNAENVTVLDYEMESSGKIVEIVEEDEESSRDYASFRFKNVDDADNVPKKKKNQRDATGHRQIIIDKTTKSIDYVLSNCNVAVTTIGSFNSKRLKKLLAN
ncbi:hypothetical protein CORT_0E02520 [Candida orthopsilosis Co 90-125]|uniref:Survival protein SurE-like phosphatase/nucleotidase domain-containing protein n=1 Tax=Candida orthopsilosis (strain 90-125) TaxID=1136231 RepID=H8X7Q4_CANO9|nr:hypothetical protein CORT_0E02520 [Candida orthopsilosis Co 90-125]CCG23839.1 hypothetical protein CORT_0E02520 [Candida orthopsilosis Co 90-125]